MNLRRQRLVRSFILILGGASALVSYLIVQIGPPSWEPWPDNIGLLFLVVFLVLGCFSVRRLLTFRNWLCVLAGSIIGVAPLLSAWIDFLVYRISGGTLSIMGGLISGIGNHIVNPADCLFLVLGASFDISSSHVAREYLMLSWIAYTLVSVMLWTLFFLGACLIFNYIPVKGDSFSPATYGTGNTPVPPEVILAAARHQRNITFSLLALGGIGLLACWPLVRLATEDWKQLSEYLGCMCFVLFSISFGIAMRKAFLRARRCILIGMMISLVPTLIGLVFELICRDCAEISTFTVFPAAAISAAVIAPTACFLPAAHFPFPPGPVALDREHLLVAWLNHTLAAAAFWTLISIFISRLYKRIKRQPSSGASAEDPEDQSRQRHLDLDEEVC